MELPKIAVNFADADPQCELVASIGDVYEIDPSIKVRKGTFLIGTDGDFRCKLEVIETLPKGQLRLAMHLDTWRQKVTADE